MKTGIIALAMFFLLTGCSKIMKGPYESSLSITSNDSLFMESMASSIASGVTLGKHVLQHSTDLAVRDYTVEVLKTYESAATDLSLTITYLNFGLGNDIDSIQSVELAMLENYTDRNFSDSLYISLEHNRLESINEQLAEQREKTVPDLLRNFSDKYWSDFKRHHDSAILLTK